jgi:23S rRNA (cytidine1920-2'-O)/16S rRNA (cytidine1409-2'-O)-methyltransferase
MVERIRLDHLLVKRGLAESGAKAQALIMAGRVIVPGKANPKPGMLLALDQAVELKEGLKYVSRGGDKLEGAFDDFKIDVTGRRCLDVGASTGGFTDCLLQRGAVFVAAVDVGHGQMHEKLRKDARVVNREKTHAADLKPADIAAWGHPNFVVVDVSFISISKILPHLAALAPPRSEFVVLLKPQFEVGPKNAPKGVVKDEAVRAALITDVRGLVPSWGFDYLADSPSRLEGPKGNREHFFYLRKKDQ